MNTAKPSSESLWPAAYAGWRASQVGAITDGIERRLILELLGEVKGLRVLDVGCGDGELAVALSELGGEVVGVDLSPAMIEAAERRAQKSGLKVAFKVASAQKLPFRDAQFDVVVAVTVLCFVRDTAPVFQEMARVMRPGGRLVIGELGKWSFWAAQRRIRGWFGSRLWREGRFRTATELATSAKAAGLQAASVRGAVYYPRWSIAARALAPYDRAFSRRTNLGAAFLALRAVKPGGQAGQESA